MVIAQREELVVGSQSSYLKYLPTIYSENEFAGRFLMIFESVLGPLESMVANLAFYLDPGTRPEELLPWLASWMKVELNDNWPVERRRELVKSLAWLFQWRGTRRGLREFLRLYTGIEPQITEDFGGIVLTEQSELGRNTVLGGGSPNTFTVTFETADPSAINEEQVKTIIEASKPAHAGYILRVVRSEPREAAS